MSSTYSSPKIADAEIRDLMPVTEKAVQLLPETPVVIIHRGITALEGETTKFDGKTYRIEPGFSRCRYDMARHFQQRNIVPGSRDPLTNRASYFIGIVNVDRPEKCEPFTPEQIAQFNLAPEGLAVDASVRKIVDTAAVLPRITGNDDGKGFDLQTDGAAAMAPGGPLHQVPPEQNVALAELRADAAAASAQGDEE